MKHITFYLDFISPYAWLAFERLPDVLAGLNYSVVYRPVLLGALLQQHGNPGPAGIAPKRNWTYRHVTWLGHAQGTPLQMPVRHPLQPAAVASPVAGVQRRWEHQSFCGGLRVAPCVARRARRAGCLSD